MSETKPGPPTTKPPVRCFTCNKVLAANADRVWLGYWTPRCASCQEEAEKAEPPWSVPFARTLRAQWSNPRSTRLLWTGRCFGCGKRFDYAEEAMEWRLADGDAIYCMRCDDDNVRAMIRHGRKVAFSTPLVRRAGRVEGDYDKLVAAVGDLTPQDLSEARARKREREIYGFWPVAMKYALAAIIGYPVVEIIRVIWKVLFPP
jgi:phage FluMu protein Com